MFKDRVEGPVRLGLHNLDGDAQADLRHHGGPDKAICVYPKDRYSMWSERLGIDLGAGDFGENFTVTGQDEDSVCLGDRYRIGQAVVQVTQPRSPCWKLARRWHPSLALWFQESGHTGWYLRVLQEGLVQSGQPLELLERPHDTWTILKLNLARYQDHAQRQDLEFLANCEALSSNWRNRFQRMLKGERADDQPRLQGPAIKPESKGET